MVRKKVNFHRFELYVQKSGSLDAFLDAQASLAPTHVSPLVGNTFEFPLPLNISVQQWSLMSISYFKIVSVCVCVCVCVCVYVCVCVCAYLEHNLQGDAL